MFSCLRYIPFLHTLIVLIGLLQFFPTYARWATPDDADIEYVKYDSTYDVNKDGTYISIVHIEKKILTEASRRDEAIHVLTFDKAIRNMEVLSAKTIVDGNEYPVALDSIEVKPLASDPIDICQNYQIIVPFPNVAVGAVLLLEYKVTSHYNEVPGFFAMDWFYVDNAVWKDSTVTINTDIPLSLKIHDPRKSLKVSQSPKTIIIKNTKPIIEYLVEESNHQYLAPEQLTYVSLSSERDYQRAGKVLGQKYEAILQASTPPLLEKIVSGAKSIEDETAQINYVLAQLVASIHYFSSSCTAEGKAIARPLADIVNSGYGDCKDFSVSLVKVLRELGYQADVALVERSDISLDLKSLPNIYAFNHAIVRAISPTGKIFWLDPTNHTAMADGIYPDIADRPSLVLRSESPYLDHIPAINTQMASRELKQDITLNPDSTTHVEGQVCFKGESAQPVVDLIISTPKSVVEDAIAYQLSQTGNPQNPTFDLPSLETCAVVPLNISYRFDEANMGSFTNLGVALSLGRTWADPYFEVSDKDEGTLFTGIPETVTYRTTIQNVHVDELDSLAYEISTPWLSAKRELREAKGGVVITEEIKKLKSVISADELKSKEFKDLRDKLKKYCGSTAIVLQAR